MMAKKITLDDIAKATNLSKYAVSRAVSGKPGISEQTRLRILNACRELGYEKKQPGADSKIILLFIPKSDASDAAFWMKVVQGVESTAAKRGYALQVKTIRQEEDPSAETEIKKASGVIFAGYLSIDTMKRYYKLCPSILMTYPPEDLFEIDCIFCTDNEAGRYLCEKLIGWGHTRMAYYGNVERPSSLNRVRGIGDALKKHGLEPCELWDKSQDMTLETMMEKLAALKKMGRLPTAILCGSDQLAQSMRFLLGNLQLSVPEDVSLVSFNSDLKEEQFLPFTSMGLNKSAYGKQAFNCLFDRMQAPAAPIKRVSVLHTYVDKKTAGICSGSAAAD